MGNYRLRGAHQPTHTRAMSLRSCVPQEKKHVAPRHAPRGLYHREPASLCPVSPPRPHPTIRGHGYTRGLSPYRANRPRDTSPAQRRARGRRGWWPTRFWDGRCAAGSRRCHHPTASPTASRVRRHTREISRGYCASLCVCVCAALLVARSIALRLDGMSLEGTAVGPTRRRRPTCSARGR